MCACRQKKSSFLIEDILDDAGRSAKTVDYNVNTRLEDLQTKFSVITEVQRELGTSQAMVNLEHRRNTYPLYPTPVKANFAWPYKLKSFEQRPGLYSEPVLNSDQILRSQLSMSRYVPAPYSVPQYNFDRVPCCSPWWGVGGRRKGGQVRFSAAQTGALERRFGASKYLSPDERRALASSLRLSDRQVKTWFQNRRAKWRRTTSESADPGSPASADASDDDVHISES
ncbi:unnamed protein product [Colias eurytheme]|nr:unnamed protein product [Colias eurytheme]